MLDLVMKSGLGLPITSNLHRFGGLAEGNEMKIHWGVLAHIVNWLSEASSFFLPVDWYFGDADWMKVSQNRDMHFSLSFRRKGISQKLVPYKLCSKARPHQGFTLKADFIYSPSLLNNGAIKPYSSVLGRSPGQEIAALRIPLLEWRDRV